MDRALDLDLQSPGVWLKHTVEGFGWTAKKAWDRPSTYNCRLGVPKMQAINDLVVLYVEDDLQSREVLELLMKNVLRLSQYYIFASSENFTARYAELPIHPNLLFLDIQMKPHSGYEVLNMIREHPEGADVKVIALTASVTVEEVQDLKRAGFDGLIAKPIKGRIFPQLVKKIVDGEPVWVI
jgi:CheY-like chemotaxis protein